MSYVPAEETSGRAANTGQQAANQEVEAKNADTESGGKESAGKEDGPKENAANGKRTGGGGGEATVIVRGETVSNDGSKSQGNEAPGDKGKESQDKPKEPKKVSEAKVKLQSRLPALGDDGEVGMEKNQVVTRDGKADLAFSGTLLASAAPASAPKGKWQEYRVYATTGGKHVFSKTSRSVFADEEDTHEAEVFDPSPSMPSQLLRSARELTRSRPVEWTDAAADFFGYDPLAKDLYRKLGDEFEEHIS